MKNQIKVRLSWGDKLHSYVNADVIERNEEPCTEGIRGPLDCGSHMAVVRDIVHQQCMELNPDKVITITIEE